MDATLAKYRDIFDKKTFAYIGTVGAGGSPKITPVWCEFEGYLGKDRYPGRRPGEVRVIVKVVPERVQGMG